VLLVHGLADQAVGIKLSRRYERAAKDAGGDVELIEVEGPAGDHRAHLDPRNEAWPLVVRWLASAMESRAAPDAAASR
jgi:dipeptidyl aminopeptidase/acylaminoacyl peptidase